VDERREAVLVVRQEGEGAGLLAVVDLRGGALEVVPLGDLLARLIHRVVDLLEVDGGGDVERGCLGHALPRETGVGSGVAGQCTPGTGGRQARKRAGRVARPASAPGMDRGRYGCVKTCVPGGGVKWKSWSESVPLGFSAVSSSRRTDSFSSTISKRRTSASPRSTQMRTRR